MRDVSNLNVVQVRIFSAPGVPFFRFLRSKRGAEFLAEKFGFAQFAQQGEIEYSGQHGFVAAGGAGKITIEEFVFGPRRLALEVFGTSAEATAVYGDMIRQLSDAAGCPEQMPEPMLLREETRCECTFEFEAADLLRRRLREIVSNEWPTLLSDSCATARISLRNLRFLVEYSDVADALTQNGVLIAPKELVIEPLAKSPPAEMKFFTQSPADSDTHLAMLRSFEESILRA